MATTAAIVPALTPPIADLAAASPAADPPDGAADSSAYIESCGNNNTARPEMTANIFFESVFILKTYI